MSKFSEKTFPKLNLHLSKLRTTTSYYEQNYQSLKEKKLQHSRIFIRNKNLVNNLLIELIFFNIQALKITNKKKSLYSRILIKNKKFFINKNLNTDTYLLENNKSLLDKKAQKLVVRAYNEIYELILFIERLLSLIKTNIKDSATNNKVLNLLRKTFLILNQKIERYFEFIMNQIIAKWYLYFARFLVISVLHFIPFIQLSATLFYNQPNKQITHPITSYLFNFIPFLVPIVNLTMPILNQDTISFLLLVPYLYFFIYSFKKYKISRKIAYQGSFALGLMLFRYSLILSQEAVAVIYKFTKRFFFLRKFQKFDLLREDMSFYIEDLEEMRNYREDLLQLGESIFSLNDLTKITKLWESTTIFSFLGVIALLYNYMYFIFRGQKPIIPVVTKTVQRMMIDRNGKEP